MLSTMLAPALARRGIHYGWAVVAVTFLTMLATSAAMGMPGVLLLPLQGEFGWDAGQISGALALRLLLFGLMAPFAAALMQRYGMRVVVATALGMIVAGLTLASRMTALWELWITWGLIVGLATGMTATVLGATVANRWFVRRRGLVIGLLSASSATGQLLFLPVAAWLADHLGWRMAMMPAGIACAVCLVLVVLVVRDHPGELGQPSFGETVVVPPPRREAGGGAVRRSLDALAWAARRRTFWILFGTFFVCGLSTNGLVQNHFIPLCHDYGMEAVAAAGVLAMMGVCDFFGTIGSGWLSDRFDNRWLLFWYYGLRGLSLLMLPYSSFSLYGLSLFAVFYGLDWIATVPPTVKLAGQEFGREQAPLVFGWVFTAHQLGAATAALGAGVTRDALASYLPAFVGAGLACLLAALAALAVRRRKVETAILAAD
jgi:sugar phosphate permease